LFAIHGAQQEDAGAQAEEHDFRADHGSSPNIED
jgi:hypothetical protein